MRVLYVNAMAYGANSQYFSTWVVASSLQPFG